MYSALNMLTMPTSQILLYEEMNAISSRMAAAARMRDWETLNRLARSVSTLRVALLANESDASREFDDDILSEDDMQKKALLIQRILNDDAEIRRHTEPWMENVCCFLGAQTHTQAQRQRQRQAHPRTVTAHAAGSASPHVGDDPNLPRC